MLNKYLITTLLSLTIYLAKIHAAAFPTHELKSHAVHHEYYNEHTLNEQILQGECHENNLRSLLIKFKTDLPSKENAAQHIEKIKQDHPDWSDSLAVTIKLFNNPMKYQRARYPSRMSFHGASDCEQVFTALAIAKICNMKCMLIHGPSIEVESGAIFLETLFKTLRAHPEEKFLVIFEELTSIAKFNQDKNQRAMVAALWYSLDSILHDRHICVIGTDRANPNEYEPQIKTRLFAHTYKFSGTGTSSITQLISLKIPFKNPASRSSSNVDEEKLAQKIESPWIITRNFQDIDQYVKCIPHLSAREVYMLCHSAIETAIHEKLTLATPTTDRKVTVELKHFDEAWKDHKQSILQKILSTIFY